MSPDRPYFIPNRLTKALLALQMICTMQMICYNRYKSQLIFLSYICDLLRTWQFSSFEAPVLFSRHKFCSTHALFLVWATHSILEPHNTTLCEGILCYFLLRMWQNLGSIWKIKLETDIWWISVFRYKLLSIFDNPRTLHVHKMLQNTPYLLSISCQQQCYVCDI